MARAQAARIGAEAALAQGLAAAEDEAQASEGRLCCCNQRSHFSCLLLCGIGCLRGKHPHGLLYCTSLRAAHTIELARLAAIKSRPAAHFGCDRYYTTGAQAPDPVAGGIAAQARTLHWHAVVSLCWTRFIPLQI